MLDLLALVLVHPKNYHNFVSPNSDELLDTSYPTSRQFTKKNHAVNVIVLQQLYVCTHLGDLNHQVSKVQSC